MALSRRAFVESTLGLAALLPGMWLAWAEKPHEITGALTVYDRRFPAAQNLARSLSPGLEPSPVGGDATQVAAQLLQQLDFRGTFTVSGVTAESLPFCLHQLAGPALRTALEIRRLDRDLFTWTVRLWRR